MNNQKSTVIPPLTLLVSGVTCILAAGLLSYVFYVVLK